jgi:RNA recognition motif-containing protein
METEELARQAIERFNGGELQGKVITVSEAREPRKDREGGSGRGGFSRGSGRGGGGGRTGSGSGYSRGPGRGDSRY